MKRFLLSMLVGLAAVPAMAGEVMPLPPQNPDPAGRYLFYMHGYAAERPDMGATEGKTAYDAEAILVALGKRDWVVIGERRAEGIAVRQYAQKVADQVNGLLEQGVDPSNITIAGHSKGGVMSLIVAALVRQTSVNYVSLAGCIRPNLNAEGEAAVEQNRDRIAEQARRMRGRVLSVYDSADQVAGSCKPLFGIANRLKAAEEKVLETGQGHDLFRRPQDAWIDILEQWSRG